MYELVVIGAGPAGISVAVEARHAGIRADKIVILEKSEAHSWTLRKLYPENKPVAANYKGHEAVCHGVMCIPDLSKEDTLSWLDRAIVHNNLQVHYQESVMAIHQKEAGGFIIVTNQAAYDTQVCVIAIGIFGKPKKPDYPLPRALKRQIHFDVTSCKIENATVLVVGGGDSASEYVQYLHENNNRTTLSYRREEFTRMNDINRESLLALEQRGAVEILRSSNIATVEVDHGRPKVVFVDKGTQEKVFDHLVYALGGTTPQNFLRTVGIEFDGQAPLLKAGYETNLPGLFLIGDLAAGRKGGSIISAFNSSHSAMQRICDNYLNCTIPLPWGMNAQQEPSTKISS
ncbi:MAG: NAD(P)-binding domain-containing protein [bacterium]